MPSPVFGADRMQGVEVAELRAVCICVRDVATLQAVDLVERDHDRHAEREDARGDEAVAGADALARREHEQHGVDILERRVDRALHALGQCVERPLETRQVGEDELVVVAVRDPEDPAPRRLRLVGDDRDLAAAERVDERGLADVRPPGDGDEAATSRGQVPRLRQQLGRRVRGDPPSPRGR